MKNWQLNVVVVYFNKKYEKVNRLNVLDILTSLASFYKLDCATSVEHQFSYEPDLIEQNNHTSTNDLVYFRSNEHTRLVRKEFRSIFDNMFRIVPSQLFEGVEIWTQPYKFLNDFPFPSEFYRHLGYPFVEHHKGSQKKLLVYADEILKVIEKEQDFPLN